MADPIRLEPVVVTSAARRRGGVRTFMPKVSVILRKNIGRSAAGGGVPVSERFKGAARTVDLTPYLGDAGGVVVSKSIRQPEGMFSIVLTDRMTPDREDSLYGLIEPMDVIEIRMAHDVSDNDYAALPKHMPLMMRGFVGDIGRDQIMTDRGPRRAVMISGQDYGKILKMMRVVYLPGEVLGQNLLSSFKFFMNYGAGDKSYNDAAAFILDVVQKVILPFQAQMRGQAGGSSEDAKQTIIDLNAEVALGTNGAVFPFGVNEWPGGTIYDLLAYFGDVGAWNELFVEDREDQPYLVYRPTPFKNINGDLIQPVQKPPETIVLDDQDLVGISARRSDESVANYFWVDAPRYNLIDGGLLQAGAQANQGGFTPNPFLTDYPNSSPILYGTRLMQTQTQQGMRVDGQAEADVNAGAQIGVQMVNEKRRVLIENNRDNVVYETGTMRLKGNEKVKPGRYLRLRRGGGDNPFTAEYYAHQVTHEYVPFRSYTTTVQFDRGTGFIERIQRGGGAQSPYLSEMSMRGTSGGG
jgi:hypothetical protein